MKLTNDAIGQRIGLSHSGVSRLLTGERAPSVATMKRIAIAFEVDLSTVVEAASTGEGPAARDHWGRWFRALIDQWEREHPNETELQASSAAS